MQRKSIIAITILAVAILTAPPAVGSWKSLGGYEPDTRFDEVDGWMWPEPNPTRTPKVYLNVVPSNPDLAVNPNSAELGSRIQPVGKMGFEAFYGVWVDCNKDGYIGHFETAMFEYRSEILTDQTVCPFGNSPHNVRDINPVSSGWVSELLWISPPSGADGNGDGVPDGRDGRSYKDLGARIWGDYGLPGDTMGQDRCAPLEPVNVSTAGYRGAPRGTYQSTGAFLDYADCLLAHRGFDLLQPTLADVGLGFDEEHAKRRSFDQEGHPLNQQTLGRSDHNQTMLKVYDCSGPRERVQTGQSNVRTEEQRNLPGGYKSPYIIVTDAYGQLTIQLHWNQTSGSGPANTSIREVTPTYRVPSVGSPNTGGSAAGTYSHVTRGAQTDCDPGDKGGDVYSFGEGDVVPELAVAKNRVTARFGFFEEQRSGAGKRGNPFEGGVYPVVRGVGLVIASGSRWYWEADANDPPVLPQVVRTSDFQFQGGEYWTFYANMSSTLLSTGIVTPANGATGSYGDEWCGGQRSGIVNGFVCDPDQWYRGKDGALARDSTGRPLADYYPKIGQTYYMRDIDCFDGSLARGQPVYASSALLSERGPCVDAATP